MLGLPPGQAGLRPQLVLECRLQFTGIILGAMIVSRILGPLVGVALLAGCGGGGTRITSDQLRSIVLQPADLSRVFVRFDEGRQIGADAPPGERGDPTRFGREGGWKARYRRAGTPQTPGPLVIESRADLFDAEDGAEKDLAAHRDQLRRMLAESPGTGRLLEPPDLGRESIAMTFVEGSSGVRFYVIAWRQANVTASIFANGFDGRFTAAHATQLARRQARRIERTAGD